MPYLTAIDLQAIQGFVFASNKLRDVVCASYVVDLATSSEDGGLIRRALKEAGVENPEEAVIMAGGGNALVVTDEKEAARRFAGRFTYALLDEVPGLEATLVCRPYGPGELARALRAVQVDLTFRKMNYQKSGQSLDRTSARLLGLPVTERCSVTAAPASTFIPTGAPKGTSTTNPSNLAGGSRAPVSSLVEKFRTSMPSKVRRRWRQFLEGSPELDFPMELDEMGRTPGTRSLMGVVHLDGNSLGAAIKDWLGERLTHPDEVVRTEYKEWSEALREHVEETFKRILQRLVQAVEVGEHGSRFVCGTPEELGFALARDVEKGMDYLPIRPILLGGDDLTFVCDGRIALDLAAEGVRLFKTEIPHLGEVAACAGVAIVGSHSPFIRAYELADKLCRSAKTMAQRQPEAWKSGGLDWHLGPFRPGAEVTELPRPRTCRPYPITSQDPDGTWEWFAEEVLGPRPVRDKAAPNADEREGSSKKDWSLRGPAWSERRSKVHELAEMAGDPEAVREALKRWAVTSVEDFLKLPEPIESRDKLIGALPDARDLLDILLMLRGRTTT